MADTIIKNIKLLEAGAWHEADLVIEDGRVAGHDGASVAAAHEVDGDGRAAFLGVDLHVHFNEPGRTEWGALRRALRLRRPEGSLMSRICR